MKTIGMLGGMSWESTTSYYVALNEGVKKAMGEHHSAKIVLHSVDFEPIKKLQHEGEWDKTAVILGQAAKSVEAGGAEFLLICTNTMHKVAPEIEAAINIPILHIADATAEQLQRNNITKVGLLGTRFTMSQDFYKGRLIEKFGIDVVVPNEAQQAVVHDIIYGELCLGEIKDASREKYVEIIRDLHKQGAQGVILGCTEIALLVQQEHTSVPLFDTTAIHSARAVELAISEE
ncbi:MAG: aspartate racemase [Planctomycetota bacterium]|jgi:aspartate racemase